MDHPDAHQGSNGVWYPCYRYQAHTSVRVESEREDRALQGVWFDHPPTSDEHEDVRASWMTTSDRDDVDVMLSEEAASLEIEKKKVARARRGVHPKSE
jgi:hypothetical protein